MIGVGVTTFNRPDHFSLWMSQIKKFNECDKLYTAVDGSPRLGIAKRKNECIRNLNECDYIFLFDDDCFPIKPGWAQFFIDEHKRTGQHHFIYVKDTPQINKEAVNNGIEIYDNCGGAFMFITRDCIEKVGYFHKDYGVYGFEHAGYTGRIYDAGLNTMGRYLVPQGAGDYIYAMDYDFNRYDQFQRAVKHRPSLYKEIINIDSYINKNRDVFMKDKGYHADII